MGRAARAVVAGFAALAVLQVALAAGAPLGRAAWGGEHAHLTTAQRVGSAVSAVFYLLAIAVVRGRATGRIERRYRWGTWALAVVMGLSVLVNVASGSRWENLVMAPLALVLAVLCTVVAREPPPVSAQRVAQRGVEPRAPTT